MTENPFEVEFGKNEYFLNHKEEIIDEAMQNAYLIITSEKGFEELMSERGNLWLPFNPNDVRSIIIAGELEKIESIINDIIKYFESTEEYEKCIDLVDVINYIKSGKPYKHLIKL